MSKLSLAKTHDYCGEKEPKLTVVMIHGIATNSSSYDKALTFLEKAPSLKNVRFVTFDLLGAGKSLKDDTLNYDYKEQTEALHNAIEALEIETPLVLVGHSLGTFIVTKYADKYKGVVAKLVLISPPIYTPEDLDNPAFAVGMKAFYEVLSVKNRQILQEKAFKNSMENIVLRRDNYKTLAKIKVPAVLICGKEDQLIASYNVPRILKDNPKYISAVMTHGRHGISQDKYEKIQEILEEELGAETI